MTNQEAQFILNAYRPGGSDANEPTFADALRQAQQDPALSAWFAREQKHASTVAAKLREITPPAQLRAAILAGARVSGNATRAWWTRPVWLAAAASVAVLLTLTALWSSRISPPAMPLEAFAVDDTLHAQHGGHGTATGALNVALSQPTTRIGGSLPVDFATLRATGCRTLSFAGHDVLEVCFARNGSEFHLYIARSADFPEMKSTLPDFGERARAGFATWADSAYRYVIVGQAGVSAVKSLL
jgi:hypothetical protein